MPKAARKRNYSDGEIKRMRVAVVLEFRSQFPGLDKSEESDERNAFVGKLLNLRKPIGSITELSGAQLGLALDLMKGKQKKQAGSLRSDRNVIFLSAERASKEQIFTIRKLLNYLKWSDEARTDFLTKRGFPANIETLRFKKATSLTNILLNIAAHKDLKSQGKKTGRAAQAKYLKTLKRKLEIDQ